MILTRYTKSPTDLPLLTAELRLLVRAAAAAAASVPAGTPPASYRIHLAAANAAGAPEARGHAEQPHPASMVTGAPPPIKAPTRSECVEVNGEDGGLRQWRTTRTGPARFMRIGRARTGKLLRAARAVSSTAPALGRWGRG